jgi:hypothetical protein
MMCSCRYRRDKLAVQLQEAVQLKESSDRRQRRVEDSLRRQAGEAELALFRQYVARREQLLQEQRACEDAERSILLDA